MCQFANVAKVGCSKVESNAYHKIRSILKSCGKTSLLKFLLHFGPFNFVRRIDMFPPFCNDLIYYFVYSHWNLCIGTIQNNE